MFTSSTIPVSPKDVIHDVAYHWYGKRIAFSTDECVKVYGLGDDRQWLCTSSWKAHSGSVWRVKWAHPEFGDVLVTCSTDRTVAVWEEIYPQDTTVNAPEWVKKASLTESRSPVTDVKFAPRHLGLQLATCSAYGYVRIYECPDVMDKSQWSLQQELYWKPACSSLSWSFCRNQLPMIAVGSDDQAASDSKVLLLVYSEKNHGWQKLIGLDITDPVNDLAFAPCIERSYHHLAIASKSLQVLSITPVECSKNPEESPLQPVDCNKTPEESIPQRVDCRKSPEESLQPGDCSNSSEESLPDIPEYEIKQVAQLDHKPQVLRVSWNTTGRVLVSSGDDSTIRHWKANPFGVWNCITVVKSDDTMKPADSLFETMVKSVY